MMGERRKFIFLKKLEISWKGKRAFFEVQESSAT